MSTPRLVENFFRHEYGKLVATLTRRVGVHNFDIIEDAVQLALMRALEHWRVAGLPENPSAWLFRVAHNNVIDDLRKRSGHKRILEKQGADNVDDAVAAANRTTPAYLSGEVRDDLLRMLFVCCDEAIPLESQLALALKTLCGFGVHEIAVRLFTSEANVYKRLTRARKRLQQRDAVDLDKLEPSQYASRTPAVHKVLYLLFTEGYLSSDAEDAIRRELCEEAIRLAVILAEVPAGKTAETFALLALMHLHFARLTGRQNAAGNLLLLEEQDRSRWDQNHIHQGLQWLSRSAQGETFSRYHAEAAIAAEHCLAPTFDDTRWDNVAQSYALLETLSPSPVHRLNRAVAVAQSQGPQAGLEILNGFTPPTWLAGSYMWSAVLADLHRRAGNTVAAERHRDVALAGAPSEAVRDLLLRRFDVDVH